MFKKLTLSAIMVAILATTISAAFAAPKSKRPDNSTVPRTRSVPMTGAEWWQNKGVADDTGIGYDRRR